MTCILLIILVALFFVYMQSFLLFGEFALFYSWPVQKAIQCLENSHCSNLDLHTKHFYLFSYLGPRQKYFYFSLQRFPHALILAHPKSHLVTGIFPLFYLWPIRKDFGELPMFYTWLVQRAFWRITLIHFLIYIQRHLISKFLFFYSSPTQDNEFYTKWHLFSREIFLFQIDTQGHSFFEKFLLLYSQHAHSDFLDNSHKDFHSLEKSYCSTLGLYKQPFSLRRAPHILFLAFTKSHLISGEFPMFYS